MKRILTYISLFVFGAALFSSCNLNESPKFDDKDAFVAFDKAAVSVKEDGGQIAIPVTLASLKGIATTISYEAVDGTAKQGENYSLVDEAGTLTFSAENRTQYILIDIKDIKGIFTGDLKFSLKFKTTGDVNEGAEKSCTITIVDNDHPLGFMLGAYTMIGEDYWDGPTEWTMTVYKDDADVTMVWFYNLCNYGSGWADFDTMFYGVVSADKKTITIPLGQTTEYVYSNGKPITLLGFDGSNGYDAGSTTATIDQTSGKIVLDFGSDYGFWAWIENAGNLAIVNPGLKAVKN